MSTSVVDSKVEDQSKKIKKPRVKKDTSTPMETPVAVPDPVVEVPATKIKKSKSKKEEPTPAPKEESTPATNEESTPAPKEEPVPNEEKPKAKRGRKPGVKKPVDENAVPAKKGRKPKVKSDDDVPVDPIPKKERKPREALDVALARIKSEGQTAIADANQKVADAQTIRENLFKDIEDLKSQEKEVLKIKNKAVRDLAKLNESESDSDDSKKKKRTKKIESLDKDSLQSSIDSSILKISQLKEQRSLLSPKFTIAKRDEKKANALLLRVQTKNDKEIAKIQVRLDKKISKNKPTTTDNTANQDQHNQDQDQDNHNQDNHNQDNDSDNHDSDDDDDDDEEDILTREIFIDGQLFLIDQHNKLYHPSSHLFIRYL